MKAKLSLAAWLLLVLCPILVLGQVYVTDYGAVGDGVADDTAAINNAIAACGAGDTLYFPGGVYKVNPAVSLTLHSSMSVNLAGSTVKANGVNSGRLFYIPTSSPKIQGVKIFGGTIQGSKSGPAPIGIGVEINSGIDIALEDLVIRDCYTDGVLIGGGTGTNGSNRVSIRRSVLDNCGRSGVSVVSGANVSFEDCDFRNTQGIAGGPNAGIELKPAASSSVSNVNARSCSFVGNVGSGFLFQNAGGSGAGHSTIIGCLFDANQKGGVVFSNAPSCVVTGNRIVNHTVSGYAGIQIAASSKAIVNGNVMENNFRGIHATGSRYLQAIGNNIFGTGLNGTGDGVTVAGPGADDSSINKNLVFKHGTGIVATNAFRLHVNWNKVENNRLRAIQLSTVSDSFVSGNLVSSNGLASAGTYEDVRLEFSSRTNNVTGNMFRRITPTTKGIVIADANSTGNHVTQNDMGGANRLTLATGTLTNWDGSANNWNK